MNKSLLLAQIVSVLQEVHQSAVNAADLAYNAATDDESKAENKYDTQGLEASYLAHGQSQRVAECKDDLDAIEKLRPIDFNSETPISIGTLVVLRDNHDAEQWLFLSPAAGGLKLTFEGQKITLITPSAPLGSKLIDQHVGDEFEINIADNRYVYEVVDAY